MLGVPLGCALGSSLDLMLVFPCTPLLSSRYRLNPSILGRDLERMVQTVRLCPFLNGLIGPNILAELIDPNSMEVPLLKRFDWSQHFGCGPSLQISVAQTIWMWHFFTDFIGPNSKDFPLPHLICPSNMAVPLLSRLESSKQYGCAPSFQTWIVQRVWLWPFFPNWILQTIWLCPCL